VNLSDLDHDPVILAMPGQEARLTQLDDLLASIPEHGLLQSLKVRLAAGATRYLVTAGNRRLAALRRLCDQKALIRGEEVNGRYPVAVVISEESDDAAREQAVAENIQRVPPTTSAEVRLFAELARHASNKDVAARFGVTEKRVQQRLKLATLHPDVLEALDAGKITMAAAQAFTVEAEPEKQAAYLKEARASWELEPRQIRQAFTQQLVAGSSPVAQLIGKTAYLAAGGQILGDEFDDKSAWWISQDVIDRLIAAHWVEQKAAWLAEGWLFVETADEFGTDQWGGHKALSYTTTKLRPEPGELNPERAAMVAALERKIADLKEKHPRIRDDYEGEDEAEWTEEEEAAWNEASELQLEREGVIEKAPKVFSAEQRKLSGVVYWPDGSREPLLGVVRPGTKLPGESGSASGKPAPTLADPGSNVASSLNETMTSALQATVAADSDIALQLLVATLLTKMRHSGYPRLNIDVRPVGVVPPDKTSTFAKELARVQGTTRSALMGELAALVADLVDVRGFNTGRHEDTAALIDFLDPDVQPKFDADNYFRGVTKALVALAWGEMTGEPMRDAKKGEMAADAAARARETGWLPPQLRTRSYVGPGATVLEQRLEAAE
jgi:ParB family chromosome partitioning protein